MQVHDDININKIRRLLDRWYAGEASPGETDLLTDMLRRASSLPEDLEADRTLLLSLDIPEAETAAMPEEVSARIDAALDSEMRRGGIAASRRRFRRRLAYYLSGAAACALIVVSAMKFGFSEDGASIPGGLPFATPSESVLALATPSATVAAQEESASEIAPAPAAGSTRKKSIIKRRNAVADTPQDPCDGSEECMERRFIADNYRVVENDAEASAIIGSVFARLDSRVTEENCNIDNIRTEFSAKTSNF